MPFNFCGLKDEQSAWEQARAVIIPVPYDLTTTYMPGTRHGPHAIIRASTQLELFDDEIEKEPALIGIHTLPEIEVLTSGPAEMIDRVESVAARVAGSGKFPVMLGGEHSISLGMVRALINDHPDMGVLQLDAHADLRDSYQGSRFNHACVARRIQELCPLIQAGIRSITAEEWSFLNNSPVTSFFARNMHARDEWLPKLIEKLPQKIYITIDLDVFDPSQMPSVGTPEPGGMNWYDVLHLLRAVAAQRKIVGFDIVELCPQPANPGPDFLAAKLCYKLLGYIHCQ
ncbi:MAG: agmatinase [Proteobacteria bacterium]|nr:agmatinase [Pseudomonadota bacterium]